MSLSKHLVEHLVNTMVSSLRTVASAETGEDGVMVQRTRDTPARLPPSLPCARPPVEQVAGVSGATPTVLNLRTSSLSAKAANLGKTSMVASMLGHSIKHIVGG
jgi:hypothetical protein